MLCWGKRDAQIAEMDNKDPNSMKNPKNKSQESLTSQESSLMSQSSLYSEHSLKSATSLQSEFSLRSQASIQSYNSLASVPSLGTIPPLQQTAIKGKARCIATLQGQGGHVFSLAMAGDLVYSGSSRNEIRVWKQKQAELEEHCNLGQGKAGVKCIIAAGDRIYCAHQDHRIRVWRRLGFESQPQQQQHKMVASLPSMKDYVMTFMLPRNYVKVRRHRKALWIQHVDTISALAVDRKGFLYSGSWDRTVKIWRPSDFRCVESFRAHDDAINALVVSGDGFLYTGSADSRVKVWNKASGEKRYSLVATLERHKSSINALALSVASDDATLLYSGACDRSIIVWEREESAQHMTVAGALRGHRRAVLCLASVGELLCSGSADRTVRVWRRGAGNSHSCMAVLDGHRGPVKTIAVAVSGSLSGFLVYTGSLDHDIKLWWVSQDDENQQGKIGF